MRYFLLVAIISSMPLTLFAPKATAATFGGYDCKDDCSGHAAGYDWAEQHDIDDSDMCPHGDSESFHEGYLVYTEDSSRGSDEDDDGHPINK
jgi:hypothetical protein